MENTYSPFSAHEKDSAANGLALFIRVGFCALLALVSFSCAAKTDAESEHMTAETMPSTHPGTEPYPIELRDRLQAQLVAMGSDYRPRTHHLLADGSAKYTNRLILEDSPYLVQHAHNPVDWYPWGDEAFARAKREGKPIFLSIGYSTCHWCHVMERESFENEAIAEILNRHFVAIKVDREQRPDVDELYMTAVQLVTGRGGWPMSSFLTPEGKPFFGGTYFPPAQFEHLLRQIDGAWKSQKSELLEQADQIAAAVQRATAAQGAAREVGAEVIEQAVGQIVGRHDSAFGGFGGAPKFPHEPELLLLLDQAFRHGDARAGAVGAAVRSLDAMARGGIYDQIGGGFHRYSTDSKWLVPHFEKMLYNQAHLTRAYLIAYRLTGNEFFARVARETLDYVEREMTAPQGGFYSATDADSEGVEGEFFVWTPDQLREVLGDEDAELAGSLWGVTEAGNFEHRNILHLPVGLDSFAASRSIALDDLLRRLDGWRGELWKVREGREHPLRDEKHVTAWNGMMITAFAQGSEILVDDRYLEIARRAADFLWHANRREDGQLWRVHLDGRSSIAGLQNDYAYFSESLIALADAGADGPWLSRASELVEIMIDRFWDEDHGGFFMKAAGEDPNLIARPKSPSDGAIPSGNSVGVRVLAQLAHRLGDRKLSDRANAAVGAFAESLSRHPAGFGYMLTGLAELLDGAAGPRQYGAEGRLKVEAELVSTGSPGKLELVVGFAISEGWHVNAHQPLQEELIATELSIDEGRGSWQLGDVDYPPGERVRLGFQDDPLLVYQGTTTLRATIEGGPADVTAPVLPVRLRVQACNDEMCLRPEDVVLEVPAALRLRSSS